MVIGIVELGPRLTWTRESRSPFPVPLSHVLCCVYVYITLVRATQLTSSSQARGNIPFSVWFVFLSYSWHTRSTSSLLLLWQVPIWQLSLRLTPYHSECASPPMSNGWLSAENKSRYQEGGFNYRGDSRNCKKMQLKDQQVLSRLSTKLKTCTMFKGRSSKCLLFFIFVAFLFVSNTF